MPKRVEIHYTTDSKKYGQVEPCGVCNGTGRVYIQHPLNGEKCTTCKGVGKVRV
jgi:hypothetical protein